MKLNVKLCETLCDMLFFYTIQTHRNGEVYFVNINALNGKKQSDKKSGKS